MAISKAGVQELDAAVTSLREKVQGVKESIRASVAKKDYKGFTEIVKTSEKDMKSLGGMQALQIMTNTGVLRHVSTGRMRLYKGIFGKAETTSSFVRFLREAIAEEYKNEWADILDPEEGYALVNPNQRAKYGSSILYSVIVSQDPGTIRYLNYVIKKMAGTTKINVLPVIVLTDNTAENRLSLLPSGGFDVYGNVGTALNISEAAYSDLVDLLLSAVNDTLEKLAAGSINHYLYGPDQLVQLIKRTFVDPNFKVNGRNLSDILVSHSLVNISPAIISSKFNRIFQTFYKELAVLAGLNRLNAREKVDLLASSKLLKISRKEVPFTIGLQVDVLVPQLHNNQSLEFLNNVSCFKQLAGDTKSEAESSQLLTGIDFVKLASKNTDSRSRHFQESLSRFVRHMEMPVKTHPEDPVRGGALGRTQSSEYLSQELGKYLQVFRTLMRKNIWLTK